MPILTASSDENVVMLGVVYFNNCFLEHVEVRTVERWDCDELFSILKRRTFTGSSAETHKDVQWNYSLRSRVSDF